eukprot:scaffold27539_cov43-Phaeocystis_antarctica.AAC.1
MRRSGRIQGRPSPGRTVVGRRCPQLRRRRATRRAGGSIHGGSWCAAWSWRQWRWLVAPSWRYADAGGCSSRAPDSRRMAPAPPGRRQAVTRQRTRSMRRRAHRGS